MEQRLGTCATRVPSLSLPSSPTPQLHRDTRRSTRSIFSACVSRRALSLTAAPPPPPPPPPRARRRRSHLFAQVFLRLFAPIVKDSAGLRGRVAKGMFTLPMQKMAAEQWPYLVVEDSLEPIDEDSYNADADNKPGSFCGGCGAFTSCAF